MAPSDGVRRSGEHRNTTSGEFVTYAHFDRFLEEFRGLAKSVTEGMSEVKDRLSEGSHKFNGLNRDISEVRAKNSELEARADGHSGLVKTLLEEKKIREALAAQDAERTKPRKTMVETILSTVITAFILGFLAVCYNVWRDAALDERVRERAAAATTAAPDAPDRRPGPGSKPTTIAAPSSPVASPP